MRKEAGIPNLEILDQVLREQGSSLEDYRQSLSQRLTIDSLLQQFVYSKLTLLTPEIEAYYQEHIEEYTEKAQVELKELLFLTEGKDKAQVKRFAKGAYQVIPPVIRMFITEKAFEEFCLKNQERLFTVDAPTKARRTRKSPAKKVGTKARSKRRPSRGRAGRSK